MSTESTPDNNNSGFKKKIWIPIIVIVAILIIAYLSVAIYYRSHFFPGTQLNGVSIGNMTVSGAEDSISDAISSYSLTITGTDGTSDTLLATDISLSLPDDGTLEDLLSSQNVFLWFLNITGGSSKNIISCTYNSSLLDEVILTFSLFDESQITYSQDATVEYSSEEKCYVVTEAVVGTELIYENVEAKIVQALNSLETTLTLTEEDYVQPTVFSDDETLIASTETLNQYVATTITYTTADATEVLDGDTISTWVSLDESGNIVIDETAIASYVQSLASKYNTYADERSFVTSLGDTITIGGGDYGWVIDKSGEAEQILSDLMSEETSIERDFVLEQTAFVDSFTDDIGNTYIELDYTNQHMYYYVNGVLILDSDFVSGTLSNGNGSPDGVFKINYKQQDTTLEGEDYSQPVTYFMPFAYNVGLHDASWRSYFGGSIYLTSGSHGCINLPSDIAEKLYSLVEIGTPVVAYYRESVSLTSTSAGISNAYSYVGD